MLFRSDVLSPLTAIHLFGDYSTGTVPRLRLEDALLDLFEALLRPLQITSGIIIQSLCMLMDIQLIFLASHIPMSIQISRPIPSPRSALDMPTFPAPRSLKAKW